MQILYELRLRAHHHTLSWWWKFENCHLFSIQFSICLLYFSPSLTFIYVRFDSTIFSSFFSFVLRLNYSVLFTYLCICRSKSGMHGPVLNSKAHSQLIKTTQNQFQYVNSMQLDAIATKQNKYQITRFKNNNNAKINQPEIATYLQ